MLQIDLKFVVAALVRICVYLSAADEEGLAYGGVGSRCRGRSRVVVIEQEECAQSAANEDTDQ